MATFRPKLGYSAWEVPVTPVERKISWARVALYVGLLAFCLSVWAFVIVMAARLVGN